VRKSYGESRSDPRRTLDPTFADGEFIVIVEGRRVAGKGRRHAVGRGLEAITQV
jgi:hypothetical protein